MSAFFKLIRWKNVLLIALMQLLVYRFLLVQNLIAPNSLKLSLLIIATVLITISGYIINDIFDIKTDSINKPEKVIIGKQIIKKQAFTLYFLFVVIGVTLGSWIAFNATQDTTIPLLKNVPNILFKTTFLVVVLLLYLYAKYFKGSILIGNIIVSKLLSISILIVPMFFDFSKSYSFKNLAIVTLLGYSYFAFFINFVREIVKDIEDVDGDYVQGYKTLPIVLGRQIARNLALVITSLILIALVYISYHFFNGSILVVSYNFALLIIPLFYCTYKLFDAKHKKDFTHISTVLKFIICFGILSIPILTL